MHKTQIISCFKTSFNEINSSIRCSSIYFDSQFKSFISNIDILFNYNI
jgi:hypothetical protein